jgi:chromate reductase
MTDRFPEPVEEQRGRIAQADALLFATPEYNYSLPAALKNAIDWASRPPNQPLAGKPAAIMGASPGMLGTGRSQMHLRQVFVFVDVHPINKPEVLVARAHEKFDAEGRLTDEATRKHVRQLVEALVAWTRLLRGR